MALLIRLNGFKEEAIMKTVKTIRTVEKVISICSWLILMFFLTGTVLAQEPDQKDDFAVYGIRQVRITHSCDPAVPSPQSQAAANAIPCATTQIFPPGSTTSVWSQDISWFNPVTKKFYLADRNNFGIDILDVTNDTVLGVATGFLGNQPGTNTSGPNGVLVTNNPHQIWGADGNSSVRVYRLNATGDTATFLTSVPTGGVKRADELAYDPDDQLILVANDDNSELFVTFISVSANKNNIQVVGKISFLGPNPANCPMGGCATDGIEQPVYDHGTGLFYLAVPQTTGHPNGEIAVIDPKTKKVVNVFGLTDVNNNPIPCLPHGLTLGPRQQLLLGCSADVDDVNFPNGRALVSIVISAIDGRLVFLTNKVGGSDEVWFNPGDNTYYLAASSWQLDKNGMGFICPSANPPANCPTTAAPVLGIIDAGSDADGPEFIQNIKTAAGAHSVAAIFYPSEKSGKRPGDRDFINKVYVPLRVTPGVETGGFGVVGRIP
jgi:hypothetical protein